MESFACIFQSTDTMRKNELCYNVQLWFTSKVWRNKKDVHKHRVSGSGGGVQYEFRRKMENSSERLVNEIL